MPVEFAWEADRHIMRWTFSPHWTWNEYDACFWQAKREGDAEAHPHCDLYLLPPRINFPPNFTTSSKGYLKRQNLGVNVYLTVMVCRDPLAYNMLSLLGRMYNWQNSITTPQYRLRVVQTEADGYRLIHERLRELQLADLEQSSLPAPIKDLLGAEIREGKVNAKWGADGGLWVQYPQLMPDYMPVNQLEVGG